MKATFQRMTIFVGLVVLTNLFSDSTINGAQAQCCSQPGYYAAPYYPPVYYVRRVWVPPYPCGSAYAPPVYVRRYVVPQVIAQPTPGRWGTVPRGNQRLAPPNGQAAVVPKAPAPVPAQAQGIARGKSRSHAGAGAEASIAPAPQPAAGVGTQALAEEQRTCPVTGQALGSMGEPYKVRVKGRDVLLCCQGCEARLMSDPDKYLAKLNP